MNRRAELMDRIVCVSKVPSENPKYIKPINGCGNFYLPSGLISRLFKNLSISVQIRKKNMKTDELAEIKQY